METSQSNVELIDKFIDNERKSKAWTIFTVVLFSLMACLVLFFAVKLKSTNQQLDITKDSLQLAYAAKDSMVNVWNQEANIADRNADTLKAMYDELKKEYDVMALLFNKSQQQYFNNNTEQASAQLTRISSELFPARDSRITANVQRVINDPKKLLPVYDGFIISIHCMPGFEDETDKISQLLKSKFKVGPKEVVKDFEFDPSVRFYMPEDSLEAVSIAAIINKSDPSFKNNPATVKRLDNGTSAHQVEVWIGDYKQQDPKQFLDKLRKAFILKRTKTD